MSVSRKIPREYENPLDNFFIDLSEYMNPYFKKLNLTPNMLTTFSLVFGLLLNYTYYKNNYYTAAVCLLIYYFFDCADGNYARKYNMQTKFGDIYDHVKDWSITVIFLIILILKKVPLSFKVISISLLFLISLGTCVHIGCTEKYIRENNDNAENSDTIALISTCPDIKYLKELRYLSNGALIFVGCIIILLHNYVK